VVATDVWFARKGNDLVVSLVGSSDSATIQGWYTSVNNQLGDFAMGDGSHLAASAVQNLVTVMATAGSTPSDLGNLTEALHTSIVGVIDTVWN
jgi:hypothetical protein